MPPQSYISARAPRLALDRATLRRNAAAWSAHAGTPLRAVVKSDGYGWTCSPIVEALDDLVAGYCVLDAAEFWNVRRLSRKPIATLAAIDADDVAPMLAADGIPNICDLDALAAAVQIAKTRRVRIRLALAPALGWSGLSFEQLPTFANAAREGDLEVEFWTHFTDPAAYGEQDAAFEAAIALVRGAGVKLVAVEGCGTAAASARLRAGDDSLRIGAGLFGARLGRQGPELECAIRVRAPVVRSVAAQAALRVGYGAVRAPAGSHLLVLRCGYGEGFPRRLAGSGEIIAVGMQHTVIAVDRRSANATEYSLVGLTTDVDALCARADVSPHEFIVGLGLASRSLGQAPG